jgi:hypothetical protein
MIDRRGNIPCLLEKVPLYLLQEITALLELAVIAEINERLEMRTVNSFEALFVHIGLFPCAIRPLVNAPLDLMTTSTTRQYLGQGRVASTLTTVSATVIASIGMGSKYS